MGCTAKTLAFWPVLRWKSPSWNNLLELGTCYQQRGKGGRPNTDIVSTTQDVHFQPLYRVLMLKLLSVGPHYPLAD